MRKQTKEIFDATDWSRYKNCKVINADFDSETYIVAELEIRGEEYSLAHYDYYMLHAIDFTDSFDIVDFHYVHNLRTAIREDINHMLGLLDILYNYEAYSLASLDIFIEAFEFYQEHITQERVMEDLFPYKVRLVNCLRYAEEKMRLA